jgi:hypothetical protein
MVWTTPKRWAVGEMVTHTLLNLHIKGNQDFLGTHGHSAGSGDGDPFITPTILTWVDQSASPGAVGTLQRNGTALEWYGAAVVILTKVGGAAGTAALRTLGSNGTQISNGTHTH